ncbi:MAG: glycosyltransferase family 2 protein [Mesorhizobium sp.]|nr:glycosyltransferase family 2 protein [Mesorhizobium sp.]MBN9241960.1 glycosyltransferase family 2 protein [Mesorhizobium sp.]
MQPDVSVLIAAFNAEGSIRRAIDSALAQRGVAVEVVVADDCSSDRTVEVAASYPKDRVRVVELDENRGPGGARNVGLAVASGRWVAVLDADDTMHPERLARMIGRAEAAGAEIAVDNLEVVRENGGGEPMFAPEHLEALPRLSLAELIGTSLLFESTFSYGYMKPMFERRFLDAAGLGYDETLRIGEDYIFLASALARGGRCVVEPGTFYRYHLRAGSISRVLDLSHVEAMLRADATFLRLHDLDPEALAAQARRTRSLCQGASFLALVRHLKQRAPLKAAGVALRDPAALRHLRMPIAARLRRLSTAGAD